MAKKLITIKPVIVEFEIMLTAMRQEYLGHAEIAKFVKFVVNFSLWADVSMYKKTIKYILSHLHDIELIEDFVFMLLCDKLNKYIHSDSIKIICSLPWQQVQLCFRLSCITESQIIAHLIKFARYDTFVALLNCGTITKEKVSDLSVVSHFCKSASLRFTDWEESPYSTTGKWFPLFMQLDWVGLRLFIEHLCDRHMYHDAQNVFDHLCKKNITDQLLDK